MLIGPRKGLQRLFEPRRGVTAEFTDGPEYLSIHSLQPQHHSLHELLRTDRWC